ncbi:hypothetical protein K3163_07570 [Qipengyuania sp. 1NDW9]|uniref:hypothetical protein n=1 Tax=Qipengyuania xiapuensis TaxID=2867236 RepID=UPI001C867FB7|nr:hypothetical protein [Qipengyuania xiapuensis]MBX7493064.1 hypothetical protein [Qipengyuania xiapuensis]
MPDGRYPDPREEDIIYDDRRISRPDVSLPDWEVPDSTYRPVPIVWFTRALILQIILQPVLFAVLAGLLGLPRVILGGTALLLTAMIGFHAWESGIQNSARGWRIATFLILAVTLGLTLLVIQV